jgi:hypothetical protein
MTQRDQALNVTDFVILVEPFLAERMDWKTGLLHMGTVFEWGGISLPLAFHFWSRY